MAILQSFKQQRQLSTVEFSQQINNCQFNNYPVVSCL
jgi:hypothetical protein